MIKKVIQNNLSAARAAEVLTSALRIGCTVLFFYFCSVYLSEKNSGDLLKIGECALLFALTFLPRLFHLQQSAFALCFMLLLLFAGILGSVFDIFAAVPLYDSVIHTLSGVVCTVFVWALLQRRGISLSKKSLFALCLFFCAGISALWEMYEFCVFSALKNPPLAARSLLAEFGLGAAEEAANAAVKENLSLTFGTVQTLVKNAYDTFCDVLCALAGAGLSIGAWILYTKHKNTAASFTLLYSFVILCFREPVRVRIRARVRAVALRRRLPPPTGPLSFLALPTPISCRSKW